MVPADWPLEVANVLAIAERGGRLFREAADRFTQDLQRLPIVVEDGDVETVFGEVLSLARYHGLSSYDASCLELARRRGLPLATLDERLRHVATSLGVTLL